MAEHFNGGGFVGDNTARRENLLVGLPEEVTADGLRGLNSPQFRAIHSAFNGAFGGGLFDGVHDFRGGDAGAVLLGAGDGGFDQGRGDKRARTVVDGHDVTVGFFEAVPDGVLPFGSAIDQGDHFREFTGDLRRFVGIIRSADKHNFGDLGALAESRERIPDERLAEEFEELFVRPAAHARGATGREDDRGDHAGTLAEAISSAQDRRQPRLRDEWHGCSVPAGGGQIMKPLTRLLRAAGVIPILAVTLVTSADGKIKPKTLAKTSQGTAALAVDPTGQPQVTYQGADYHLYHARFYGKRWQSEVVDATSDCGWGNSVAVDQLNQIHVSYHAERMNPYRQPLCYARYAGGQWQITDLPVDGWQSQLRLDGADRPHILYYDASYGLRYARFDGNAWQYSETGLAGGPDTPGFALDSANHAHVVYSVNYSGQFYASNETGEWKAEQISTSAGACDLAVDSAGNPHIAACVDGALRYYSRAGTNWTSVVLIDQTLIPGAFPDYVALVLDSADRPHFCFGLSINGVVETCWYAFDDGLGWSGAPVDVKNAGFYPSLAVTPAGVVFVAYSTAIKGAGATTKWAGIVLPDLSGSWSNTTFDNGTLTGTLTIQNHGADKSVPAKIGFVVSDDQGLDSSDIILPAILKLKGLKPGATATVPVSLSAPTLTAGKYLLAVVDLELVTTDANLTDNLVPLLIEP
ncbi:MAG: hypothetical protein PCFJNLEI_04098 [Verrucomicrobiae bacterium]|nr:hypothetical protein [Verrucomicrobiae bacterium]